MAPQDDHPEMSHRSWALWMIGAAVVMLALVAAVNALVDPTGQLGTGLLQPVSAGPRDRSAKVELLQRAGVPPLVVLGSSRSMKLDPRELDPNGDGGVNAAVAGSDLFEARVLAAWLGGRSRSLDRPFPQLVVGIDVEQLRGSSLQGSGFLDVPAVERVARTQAGGASRDSLERANRLLLTMEVTRASVEAIRLRAIEGAPAADEGGGQQPASDFDAAGIAKADARWQPPTAATRQQAAGLVDATADSLRDTAELIGPELDPVAVRDLRAIVDLAARADGPPPLLFITPVHPRVADALEGTDRPRRQRALLRTLRSAARGGRAIVVDCSDCLDGAPENWIDGEHPSPIGARRLAERLAAELERASRA